MFRQDIDEIKDFGIGGDRYGDSGCALSSVFHIAEQLNGKYYSPRLVMIKAMDMKAVGAIDKNFVVSWDKAFLELGIRTVTRFESADYECKQGEYEILKLTKPGYTHFVPGDGKGNYSWDSLGSRQAQKDYSVEEKRIITFKGFI
jgi:hypothetical protein